MLQGTKGEVKANKATCACRAVCSKDKQDPMHQVAAEGVARRPVGCAHKAADAEAEWGLAPSLLQGQERRIEWAHGSEDGAVMHSSTAPLVVAMNARAAGSAPIWHGR